ncbi:MAG: DUF3990 domain-containing protein [Firmicutes bacterium]|nr:DUF3990 domain-containing protein [Bacillota bacterium]
MELFHGSDVEVKEPKILSLSGRTPDFGFGFYTTSARQQAGEFTGIVNRRNGTNARIISVYDFDEQKANGLSLCKFDAANEAWLEFVVANRRGTYRGDKYDIIIGPVANDNVFRTLLLFERGILNVQRTIEELNTRRLFDQYVFSNERALRTLKYMHTIVL